MTPLEIQCPQPKRPKKRRADKLHTTLEEKTSRAYLYKKLDSKLTSDAHRPYPSPSPSFIEEWLDNLSTMEVLLDRKQSHSDSFLDNMRKQNRAVGGMHPPPPPSPGNSTHSSILQEQDAVSRVTSVTDSSTVIKDTRNFAYRKDVLRRNGVFIDRQGLDAPPAVMTLAHDVLKRRRNSPSLADEEVKAIRESMALLADDDEDDAAAVLKQYFPETKQALLLKKVAYSGKVVCGHGQLHREPLPVGKGAPFRIVAPRTDLNYGYADGMFSTKEEAILKNNLIAPYAYPSGESLMPWLAVDFKSQSRKGTFWVAENQCANFGSHRMNSVTDLFRLARQDLRTEDLIMFSCTIDCNSAAFWVHWREMHAEGSRVFKSTEALLLNLKVSDDVRQFPQTVRNILDFGLGERLTKCRELAQHLVPLRPELDKEEKESKSRPASSNGDDDAQTEGSTQQRDPKRRDGRT